MSCGSTRLKINLKGILIERRDLTTPERVNKVISGEKIGSDIPSRFLCRLQKTAEFGTAAVVGKALIRQALIWQMPVLIRAHLATQPDSASLENLAVLADRAVASENDVEEVKHRVAEIKVSEISKLVRLLEDLSRRLQLETATTKKKNYEHRQNNENSDSKKTILPNAQAKPFVPSNLNGNRTNVLTINTQVSRPHVLPPTLQQNAAQPIDTTNAPVCYYHQTFGDKAHTCRGAFSLNC